MNGPVSVQVTAGVVSMPLCHFRQYPPPCSSCRCICNRSSVRVRAAVSSCSGHGFSSASTWEKGEMHVYGSRTRHCGVVRLQLVEDLPEASENEGEHARELVRKVVRILGAFDGNVKDFAVCVNKIVAPEPFAVLHGVCNTIHNDATDFAWMKGGKTGWEWIIIRLESQNRTRVPPRMVPYAKPLYYSFSFTAFVSKVAHFVFADGKCKSWPEC